MSERHNHLRWIIAAMACSIPTAYELSAQTPPPPPEAIAAGPAAPVAQPSFFGGIGKGLTACQVCWRKSPVRQLLKNSLSPLSVATGGMIGGGHHGTGTAVPPQAPPAAPPPPPPAVKAAAKIKAEAKTLAARREAVRYLGTLDCHWYPEAEAGLIAALRADRSECIRLEAAVALQQRCCCTKKTMAALQVAASGSNRDGNPGERCPRVRWAALEALQSCLLHCNTDEFEQRAPLQRPESPASPLHPPESSELTHSDAPALPEYYQRLDERHASELIVAAQRTVAILSSYQQPVETTPQPAPGSLYGIWAATRAPESADLETAVPPTEQRLAQPAPVEPLPARYPHTIPASSRQARPISSPVLLTPLDR